MPENNKPTQEEIELINSLMEFRTKVNINTIQLRNQGMDEKEAKKIAFEKAKAELPNNNPNSP